MLTRGGASGVGASLPAQAFVRVRDAVSRSLAVFNGGSRDSEIDGAATTSDLDQNSARGATAPWDQGLLQDSVRQGLAEGRVWTSRSTRLAAARHFGPAALRPICSYESVPVVRAAHYLSCMINRLLGVGNESKTQVSNDSAAQDGPWRHRAREQAKEDAAFRVDVRICHYLHFACHTTLFLRNKV